VTSDRQRVMKNQQRLRRAPQPPPEALHNALISVHSNGSSPGPDPDPQQILDVLKDFPHPPNSGEHFLLHIRPTIITQNHSSSLDEPGQCWLDFK
jgi:hypothetical protein